VATLSLPVIGETPNEIYLYGTASIVLAKFGTIVNAPIGGGGGNFTVGNPNPQTLVSSGQMQGIWQKPDGTVSVSYEIAFKLPMPWNGASANWTGTWSISWTVAAHSAGPPPPTGLRIVG